MRSGSEDFLSGDYVRLCRPNGDEFLYWDAEEWKTDPVLVMGAIINSAAGFRVENTTPDPEPAPPAAPPADVSFTIGGPCTKCGDPIGEDELCTSCDWPARFG